MSEEVRDLDQEVIEDASSEEIDTQDAASLSFDDLDEISNEGVESVKESEVQAKKEENEFPIEGESEPEKVEASEKTIEEKEEQVEEIKKLIARYNDEETEIAANSLFKHKIDGEEVDVELQELLNNYSGKVSYDKKFQELAGRKKEFEDFKNNYDQDIETIYNVISGFRDSMKENDGMGALQHFANFAGMKPYEFQESLLTSLIPEVVRRANMTEEQIHQERLQAENNYLRQQQESEQARLEQEQLRNELQAEITQLQEAHGISEDEFNESYRTLLDTGYEGEINPQAVAEFHVHYSAFSKADSILNQVSESLSADSEIVESLQKVIVENPSFDDNDLLDIVNEVYGDYVKSISNKVSKKVAKTAPKKKQSVTPSQTKQEEYLDWEDL
jgi:hypothetical protein